MKLIKITEFYIIYIFYPFALSCSALIINHNLIYAHFQILYSESHMLYCSTSMPSQIITVLYTCHLYYSMSLPYLNYSILLYSHKFSIPSHSIIMLIYIYSAFHKPVLYYYSNSQFINYFPQPKIF